MAKEMLTKYNNKHLLGFPVELSWFKDLKKARAKMFEERQGGTRSFQRQGFRFRGNDRRGVATSPNGYFEGDRRMRAGSSSSGGGGMGNAGRPRYSASRSRSFTGSSSRSGSLSGRSISTSPRPRRSFQQGAAPDARGFSDGQPVSLGDRQPRNQSYRSMSRSSSSSRSSQGMQRRNSSVTRGASGQKTQSSRFRGAASPLNMSQSSRRTQRVPGSPGASAPDYSFSNAPAPDGDGGSSLVSGLIQLQRRNQPDISESRVARHKRRASVASSSSGLSVPLETAVNTGQRNVDNRLSSLSPPFTSASRLPKGSRDQAEDDTQSDFPKRKRQKRVSKSPDSLSPPPIRGSYVGPPKQTNDALDQQGKIRSNKVGRGDDMNRQLQASERPRTRSSEDDTAGGWPQSSRRAQEKIPRLAKPASESGDSSLSEVEFPSRKLRKGASAKHREAELASSKAEARVKSPEDPIEMIRQRKEALSQDYKRDCEAFTTVVRMLIGKDAELESRLMPMLKEILHERGQRCIEELRTFIADHQGELDKTEGIEQPVS